MCGREIGNGGTGRQADVRTQGQENSQTDRVLCCRDSNQLCLILSPNMEADDDTLKAECALVYENF